MSYVIQNFYNVNQTPVLNQKLYLIWLHRNSSLILTSIVKNWNILLYNVNYLHNSTTLFALNKFFFNTGFYKLYKSFLVKWNPVLTTNYTKSLQYWTLVYNNEFLEKQHISTTLIKIENTFFYNQYFNNIVVSNISLHNKYYRATMIKFIYLITSNWQLWNRNYNISFKFGLIPKNFHLIRFYNTYFFKMYNF